MGRFFLIMPYHPDSSSAVFGIKQIAIIAAILLIIWMASSGHTELEISQDLQHFRKYYAVLGFKLGKWQPMPSIVGVTLKYFATATQGSSKYSWKTPINRSEEVIVMLSIRGSNTGFIIGRFPADNVNIAIDLAHDTAERFQVEVNTYLPSHLFEPL